MPDVPVAGGHGPCAWRAVRAANGAPGAERARDMAMPAIPGVLLDDVYRLLGGRRPEACRLLVEAVEPADGAVRIRYRVVDVAGTPLADAAGEPMGLTGLK